MMKSIRSTQRFQPLLTLGFALLIVLALAGCGTLQVGIEPEMEAVGTDAASSLPTPTPVEPVYDTAVNARFGDQIELVGYTLNQIDAGRTVNATLIWRALQEIQDDYTVFIHAVDAEGALITQMDGDPAGGNQPSSGWSPGQFVIDQHTLVLPEGIILDNLNLLVGLYDSVTGERLESDPPTFTELPDSKPEDTAESPDDSTEVVAQETPSTNASESDEPGAESAPGNSLSVAYLKNENVWLWQESGGSTALTNMGGVEDVLLSDDGQRVAFRRGLNLWVVNSDGTDERNLTTQRDFAGIEISDELAPYVETITPGQLAWRPGTHTLYFNTAPRIDGPGLFKNDDLWSIDVDQGELHQILAPGEGGDFYFSPDGNQLAVVTPGRIDLVKPDGSDRLEALTHTPVITYSEFEYYASPRWAADSSSIMVAIPPVDLMAADQQPTSIWLIHTDGIPARLIGTLMTTPGWLMADAFDPQLSQIAYLFGDDVVRGPDSPPPGLAISQIGESRIGEPIVYSAAVDVFEEWSPDGTHFFYAPAGSTMPLRTIGALGEEPLILGSGQAALIQTKWVAPEHYLFLQQNGNAWEILLADIEGSQPTFVDSVEGAPPSYDFSGTPQ